LSDRSLAPAAAGSSAAYVKQELRNTLIRHREYITRNGEDMPEIRDWRWIDD